MKVVCLGILAAMLASCGPEYIVPDGSIRGVAMVTGPLEGAVVRAYAVDADGRKTTTLGESKPTGADGRFEIPVGAARGTLLLEVTGPATYVEPTGPTVATDPGVLATALVVDLALNEQRTKVTVSALTTMATALAQARRAAGKESTFRDAAERAYGLIGAHFFEVQIGSMQPADLAKPVAAVTPEVRYALALAGLSRLARDMGEASVPRLGPTDANGLTLTRRLAEDLASIEARFDGRGKLGALQLGTCAGLCVIGPATPRSDLSGAVIAFLAPSHPSGVTYNDLAGKLSELEHDREPELFPSGSPDMPPPTGDRTAPAVTWVAPHEGAAVAGAIALEVKASDETQVSTLGVKVAAAAGPADTDPKPERYLASLDTTAYPDGPLAIQATATDPSGNRGERTVTVIVNNHGPGIITGVCVKGPLRGAMATAYAYDGAPGAVLGAPARTDNEGRFTIQGIEDYSAAILVTCGGEGTAYAEEAFTWTTTMTSRDYLRAVIPSFASNNAFVVATPFSSLAVAYLERLHAGGAPLAQAHAQAYEAVADALGLASLDVVPARLDATATRYTDETWSALLLAGLSQSAVGYAAAGQVSAGAAVNAMVVWKRLEEDISDGCLDGLAGTRPLMVGGVPLGAFALRYELAQAVAAYMESSYNATGLRFARDAIDFLDHLSLAGPTVGSGMCAPGELFAEPGGLYDRVPPVIAWDPTTPQDGAYVQSPFVVKATASDVITAEPRLTLVAPSLADAAWAVDKTGDQDGVMVLEVPKTFQGDLVVKVRASDGAMLSAEAQRLFHVDNSGTVPRIGLAGVTRTDGWTAAPEVTVSVTSQELATYELSVDGRRVGNPYVEGAAGAHAVVATAIDRAGTRKTATSTFVIDVGRPVISPYRQPLAFVSGANGPFDIEAVIDDDLKTVAEGSLPQIGETLSAEVAWAGGPPEARQTAPGDGRVKLNLRFAPSGPASDGPIRVTFQGRDRAGNQATPWTWSGEVDSTNPAVAIALSPEPPAEDPWVASDVTVTVNVQDRNPDPQGLSVWHTVGTSTQAATATFVATQEGRHLVSATALDLAKNASSTAERTFYIDRTKAKVRVVTPPPAYLGQNGRFDLVVALEDNLQTEGSLVLAGATVAVDSFPGATPSFMRTTQQGAVVLSLSQPTTKANDGAVRLRFGGRDRAGNAADEVVWQSKIDNTPPVVTIAQTAGSGSVPEGAWTNENVRVEGIVGAAEANPNPAATRVIINGSSSANPTTVGANGKYTVTAEAVDLALNKGTAGPTRFNVDKTVPEVRWVTPAPPAGGTGCGVVDVAWIQPGLEVSATATDAYPNEALDPHPTLTVRSGLADTDTVQQTVKGQLTGGDVDLVVELEASDAAGNRSPVCARTFKLDGTPPSLPTFDLPNGKWIAGLGTGEGSRSYALTGKARDDRSGVSRVEVYKNSALVGMTTTFSLGAGEQAWSVPVTLTQTGCTSTANTFAVKVYDRAQNVSEGSLTLNFDPCPPTLVATPTTTVLDETKFTAPSWPCLTSVGSPSPRSSPATVTKYAVNYESGAQAGCATGVNPNRWSFSVQDNHALRAAPVMFAVQRDGIWASTWLEADCGNATGQTQATCTASLNRDNVWRIDVDEGTYTVWLRIGDEVGQEATVANAIQFQNRLIGGPFKVEDDGGLTPPGLVNPLSGAYGLGAGQTLNDLVTPGAKVVLQGYRITNASRDTEVQMVLLQGAGTAQVPTRVFRLRNVNTGAVQGDCPDCGFGPGQSEYGAGTTVPGFVTGMDAWLRDDGWGTWTHVDASGNNSWTVPAGKALYVYVLTSGEKMTEALWDEPWAGPADFTVRSGLSPFTTYNLFGTEPYTWDTGSDCNEFGCWYYAMQYLKHLQSVEVTANDDTDVVVVNTRLSTSATTYGPLAPLAPLASLASAYRINFRLSPTSESVSPP